MSAGPQDLAVDIVVTNHNYGRFLGEALQSALGQTHPSVNVVAVDDGSTDESGAVLDRYGERVEVVRQERGGQAAAINAGLEHCHGDVLLLLDADDRLLPHAAASVAASFAADAELAKVQFRMAVVDAGGRPTGETKPVGHLRPPTGDVRRAELWFPFDLPWMPGGGTAFDLRKLRRVLPIPADLYPDHGADWYLVHLAALLGTAEFLDLACAEYRVHGRNGYEQERSDLDLEHVRKSIRYAAATRTCLERRADELGLARPRPLLAVADQANRVISRKLDPRGHPIEGDRHGRLLTYSVRAVKRRFDVTWSMKAIYLAWFVLVVALPRGPARRLIELFLFPARRRALNGVLGRLQRRGAAGAGAIAA